MSITAPAPKPHPIQGASTTAAAPNATVVARRDPRADRAAFERAFGRYAQIRPGHDPSDLCDEVSLANAYVGRRHDLRDAPNDDQQEDDQHTQRGISESISVPGAVPAVNLSSTTWASAADLGDRDDRRRRWLHEVLDALDAACGACGPTARLGGGLVLETTVPGIGAVSLHLTWPSGLLQVRLRPLAREQPLDGRTIDTRPVDHLRQALASRIPPVPLDADIGVPTQSVPPIRPFPA